jgi:regulator of protease activity HflC (stomatin/prohibitin superfamily)
VQFSLLAIVIIGVMLVFSAIRVLREYERAVVFRLGRFAGVRGPGIILLIPIADKMVKVSLRVVTMDVAPQDIITKDNVSVKVNAVVYFRVLHPEKAIIEVEDYLYATGQLAQTTLRSTLGQFELDQLLSERDTINQKLQHIIDEQTDAWGIKVSLVEVKQVDLLNALTDALSLPRVTKHVPYWLAIRWATDQFNTESVLFREGERWDIGLWVKHLLRDRDATPSMSEAVSCGKY